MRTIDADALKEIIEEKAAFIDGDSVYKIIDLIDNAPTVAITPSNIPNYGGQIVPDVLQGWRYEERPQSKWIDKEYYFTYCSAECSNCSVRVYGKSKDTGSGYEYSFYNFCPNCGAKMINKEHINE